jgi:hypothetical protein
MSHSFREEFYGGKIIIIKMRSNKRPVIKVGKRDTDG